VNSLPEPTGSGGGHRRQRVAGSMARARRRSGVPNFLLQEAAVDDERFGVGAA
jgi:hypothetical protein